MQDSSRLTLLASSLGGKDEGNAALDDRMHSNLSSQEQSLYPYGHEENDI